MKGRDFMKILVAGASGLIGGEVVRLLKERGHYVRTLSRDSGRAAKLKATADDVRLGDATLPGTLDGVCVGIECVVSALGAPVSPSAKGTAPFASVDLAANLALLAEARRAGVRRYVYVGVHTEAAYAGATYVLAHTQVEKAVRESGLEYGFIRPTGVFGSLAEMIAIARKGALPLIGGGEAMTNPVHETDVAEAVMTAVTAAASCEIDIGGPETMTRRQIAELAFNSLNRRPRLLTAPVWVLSVAASLYGLVNPRMGEFLRFIILASTNSCVATAVGSRRIKPYFEQEARKFQ
jgi:uncharacterized protein YbjT (DUF2867 family)